MTSHIQSTLAPKLKYMEDFALMGHISRLALEELSLALSVIYIKSLTT